MSYMDVLRPPWADLEDQPLPRFPTDKLPQDCAAMAEAVAASLPVPVDYAACALLGAASSALVGRVVVNPRPGHYEPVQLFLGMGGESGTMKSAALEAFIKPLRAWINAQNENIRAQNAKKSDQREILQQQDLDLRRNKGADTARMALREQLRKIEDVPERETIQTDTTPEALLSRMEKQGGRAIFYADEGNFINIITGAAYGKNGGTANIDGILQAYDNKPIQVDRKSGGTIYLQNAALALTIGLQPGILARMTESAELCDRGLPQRLLYFLPEPLRRINVRERAPWPMDLLREWEKKITLLAALHREQPLTMPMTKAAQNAFMDFHQSVIDRAYTDFGGSGALRSWANKAHGKCARLAAILTLLEDTEAMFVECEQVQAAADMMNDYFIPHAVRVFGGKERLSPAAQAVLDLVRDIKDFKQAEILHKMSGQRRFKGENGKATFKNALVELERHGYIRKLGGGEKTGRGRPASPVWEVHPALKQKTLEEGALKDRARGFVPVDENPWERANDENRE